MSGARDTQVEEVLEQRATEWFVRHREGAPSSAEQRQFMQWLRASPRHVAAYLKLTGMVSGLPEALAGLDEDVEQLAARIRHSPREAEQALFAVNGAAGRPARRSLSRWAWAAAVVLALAGTTQFAMSRWLGAESVVVAEGQPRLLALPDGSSVHLNAGTRLVIRYSDTQRLLELPRGQALFDVVRDPRRPFIVRSGAADVVAVGTRFDVYRRAGQTRVTVVEGKIEIIRERSGGGPDGAPLPVTAGEQVRIGDEDMGAAGQPEPVDVRLVTAWSHREVTFSGARLTDVAEEFGRSTGARIHIEDARLRDYRISGVFQTYDLDSFVSYLEQFEGVAVKREGRNIRVSGSGPKNR
jgi:transmembrane sensor